MRVGRVGAVRSVVIPRIVAPVVAREVALASDEVGRSAGHFIHAVAAEHGQKLHVVHTKLLQTVHTRHDTL